MLLKLSGNIADGDLRNHELIDLQLLVALCAQLTQCYDGG